MALSAPAGAAPADVAGGSVRLTKIPFAAATTGPTNLVASAVFRGAQHLYEYLTGELASLPGIRSVETAPIIRTLERTGSVP